MHVLKEFTQARGFGIIEQSGRIAIDGNLSAFHEDQARSDLTSKAHLMCHNDHGHAFLCQQLHQAQDLVPQLWIERCGLFVNLSLWPARLRGRSQQAAFRQVQPARKIFEGI